MIDDPVERQNIAIKDNTMRMAFLAVGRLVFSVEDGARRIQRPAQRPPVDPIDEPRPIADGAVGRREGRQFAYQLVAELIVGIEREDPRARHLRQPEIALVGKIHERVIDHFNLRIAPQYLDRSVGAAAVDDHDLLRP